MLNAIKEHKKYITAMIAGAAVTGVLAIVITMVYMKSTDFTEYKEEVMSIAYELNYDNLEHYINELDECNRKYNLLNKKHEDFVKAQKKNERRLTNLNNKLRKELEERDILLLYETVVK